MIKVIYQCTCDVCGAEGNPEEYHLAAGQPIPVPSPGGFLQFGHVHLCPVCVGRVNEVLNEWSTK